MSSHFCASTEPKRKIAIIVIGARSKVPSIASIGWLGNWLNTVWIATATRNPGTNHKGLKS